MLQGVHFYLQSQIAHPSVAFAFSSPALSEVYVSSFSSLYPNLTHSILDFYSNQFGWFKQQNMPNTAVYLPHSLYCVVQWIDSINMHVLPYPFLISYFLDKNIWIDVTQLIYLRKFSCLHSSVQILVRKQIES